MFIRTIKLALCLMLMTGGVAHADLNAFIRDLNVSVQGDIGGYKAKLEARFGIPDHQVELVFRTVDSPAEVAIIMWLGERSRKPLDTVLNTYRTQKSQGWGVMAKSLGIKPGSATFHALKKGTIHLSLDSGHDPASSAAKGNGKNKKPKKNKHG